MFASVNRYSIHMYTQTKTGHKIFKLSTKHFIEKQYNKHLNYGRIYGTHKIYNIHVVLFVSRFCFLTLSWRQSQKVQQFQSVRLHMPFSTLVWPTSRYGSFATHTKNKRAIQTYTLPYFLLLRSQTDLCYEAFYLQILSFKNKKFVLFKYVLF